MQNYSLGEVRKCHEISRVDCRNVPKQECSNQPRQQCIDYPEQVKSLSSLLAVSRCPWFQVARQVCKDCGSLEVCETLPTHNCTTAARENCQTREVREPRQTCQPHPSCVQAPGNQTVCHQDTQHQQCHQVDIALTPATCHLLFLFLFSQVPTRVPQQVCHTIEREVCEQIPSKGKPSNWKKIII